MVQIDCAYRCTLQRFAHFQQLGIPDPIRLLYPNVRTFCFSHLQSPERHPLQAQGIHLGRCVVHVGGVWP